MLAVRDDVGRALSVDEEERLLKACAASRSRSLLPAVTLALNTGLRYDELRLLTWRQVDLVHESRDGRQEQDRGGRRPVGAAQRASTEGADRLGAGVREPKAVALRVPVREGRRRYRRSRYFDCASRYRKRSAA